MRSFSIQTKAHTMSRYPQSACLLLIIAVLQFVACAENSRAYRMGFQNSSPRLNDSSLAIKTLFMWSQHADAAMITTEVPWEALYTGASTPDAFVTQNYESLVAYYRSKGFLLWVYVDPQNGMDRSKDSEFLIHIGKSIADPDVQLLFAQFADAMDRILMPNHLGLALETNLIRSVAPATNYLGVKQAATNAASMIRARNPNVTLGISVQVDEAWGNGPKGQYVGIAQDLSDFSFLQELGLSSYPFFFFSDPSELPLDYFSRLVQDHNLPVFISEGGWTSASLHGGWYGNITSSPQIQSDYVSRVAQLLEQTAKPLAWFQLPFTDIDLSTVPPELVESFKPFASLGLVDVLLQPKPSLATWDSILFARQ
eukprot:ANDGO_03373.mRNA.1 hypothetical protein